MNMAGVRFHNGNWPHLLSDAAALELSGTGGDAAGALDPCPGGAGAGAAGGRGDRLPGRAVPAGVSHRLAAPVKKIRRPVCAAGGRCGIIVLSVAPGTVRGEEDCKMRQKRAWITAAALGIMLLFWLLPAPAGMTRAAMQVIGIFAGTLLLLADGVHRLAQPAVHGGAGRLGARSSGHRNSVLAAGPSATPPSPFCCSPFCAPTPCPGRRSYGGAPSGSSPAVRPGGAPGRWRCCSSARCCCSGQ